MTRSSTRCPAACPKRSTAGANGAAITTHTWRAGAGSRAKRGSGQFALLYLDLDKFKQANDALGHTAGDELLRSVGARIRLQVRESDTVARIGGDEFTVILPDLARGEEADAAMYGAKQAGSGFRFCAAQGGQLTLLRASRHL